VPYIIGVFEMVQYFLWCGSSSLSHISECFASVKDGRHGHSHSVRPILC
jgi:hypothetical protein